MPAQSILPISRSIIEPTVKTRSGSEIDEAGGCLTKMPIQEIWARSLRPAPRLAAHVALARAGGRRDNGSMEVRDNSAEHRYEVLDDGELVGFTVYQERDGRHWFVHTEIADTHQGTGVGSFLVRRAMDDMRARNARIVPTCPFVAAWIRSHPDYQDLVDTETLREHKRSRSRRVPPGTTVSEPCDHVPPHLGQRVAAWPVDGCAECLAVGRRDWVHLRLCHCCGHVGCCDQSPGTHGRAHAMLSGHPLIRSYERDENWWYCYVDERLFNVAGAPAATSAS